ncbi:hypothetical protein WN944_015621 [Citrus x changshan-huyou]|uniref:Peptidase S9A N-terminal domain-containing protein n=1 Tax=Citrus x changshan-huyou TaxID=2935761 RepID=A0AAP0M7Y0_9ROSI
MGSLTGIDESLQYPVARRDESIVDDYHGFKIPDPYRWLEDPDAEEVKDFVQKQAELTDSVLNKCDVRDRLREKITKLFDSPQYDTPFEQGNKYVYFHNTGLQPQSVLYVQDSLDAEAKVLLDPNTLSEDGTVAITTCLGEILFGINTSMRPGMTSRYLMAEFCEPVCSVKAWCAEEQEQNYPARPRCCHSRGQFPIKGQRPFRLEVKRRGDPIDDSWQDVLSSTRI